MPSKKQTLARWLCAAGLDRLGLRVQGLLGPSFVRALNYHDVPPERAQDFERQLAFYAERFDCYGVSDLRALYAGRPKSSRPGLILTFDDGLRSHADVVAPLLEQFGWTGWFMVPVAFVDTPPEEQVDFAAAHSIGHKNHVYDDARIALSWDDVRALSGKHVVGCHTWNHTRLADSLDAAALEEEIPRAKRRLETELNQPVDVFAWVGGEEAAYSAQAARVIDDAGFDLSFMTNNAVIRPGDHPLQIQRTNVEAWDSEAVVRFQLSGLLDLGYRAKRRRVNRLTETR